MMYVRFWLLLSCLFFALLSAPAQSKLEGFMRDKNKTPVGYGTVSLMALQDSSQYSLQADSMGYFSFGSLEQGAYQLSAYALGYTHYSSTIRLAGDSAIIIALNPLSETLGELTVTGRKPVIVRRADRVIYDVSESINAAGSNGLDALKKVPGVKITGQQISLAGKGELGVMINGRLLHVSDKALVNYLKSFSAGQISKIEVITHPSAEYDAEGNSGLVNIVTKRNSMEGFNGQADASVSRFIYKNQPDYKGIKNYGDIHGGMGLNYNHQKWSAYTQFNYTAGRELWGYGIDVYYPDKHWAMKDTGEYRISTLNWVSGVDYQLNDKTSFGVEYLYGHHVEEGADYVRVPVYNPEGELDSTLKTYATYYPVAISNSINLHFIRQLSPSGAKLTLNGDYFNFYRYDRSHLVTQSFTPGDKPEEASIRRMYDTALQNIRIYTFKADAEIPTSFAQFSAGAKLSFINNYSNIYYYHNDKGQGDPDPDLSNEFRYIENTQALYVNGSKEMEKWKWNAGLRAEITQTRAISYFQDQLVNRKYVKLFPSLLASYQLNNKNRFSLSFDKRIQRPTFWNLNPYKSFMTAYTYVEGNPYLEPEYVTNIALSHAYRERLTSSVYLKLINNGFAQVTRTHDTSYYTHTTTMLNFIRAFRYGISESLSVQPFPWMETTNQLNAYYTDVRSGLDYIEGVSGMGLYLATNNTFFFNQAKTLRGAVDFWYQFPEIDHFGKSDAYYNLDLGLEWQTPGKKLTVSVHGVDLLQSSGPVIHTVVNGIKNTFTNFQIYRQVILSLSWQFGREAVKHTPASTGNEAERNRVN